MNNSIETYRRVRDVVRAVRATDYRGDLSLTEDGAIDLIVALVADEDYDYYDCDKDCTCQCNTGECRCDDEIIFETLETVKASDALHGWL